MNSTDNEEIAEQSKDDLADDTETDASATKSMTGCCSWTQFDGVAMAKGYNILGTARGAIVMSNIFLSSSFIYLASEEAGCIDAEGLVTDECNVKVRGQRPGALVANIAVISGLLSAFLMPISGAILDYTPYRRQVGILAALLITLIQAIQIGTLPETWFPMSILQAISGFIYQVEVLATYAYLPDVYRAVGQTVMTKYTATFTMSQFGAQASFLAVIIVISIALGLGDVTTAQVSQGINTVWIAIGFYFGWKYMPTVGMNHALPEGRSLLTQGFVQNWQTAKLINTHYARGLRWFLLGTMFAEAAVNSFTVLAVVFLDGHLGMSGSQIGIFFFLTLLGSLPGSKLGAFVTHRTDPNTSERLSMACLTVVTIVGALVLNKGAMVLAYVWGVCIGVVLGWFYPTEGLFFSACLPKGHEAEMSGFYVYCTQILGWLPPLIFSFLVSNDVSQKFGVMSVTVFFLVAIGLLSCAAPWDEIVNESSQTIDDHKAVYSL